MRCEEARELIGAVIDGERVGAIQSDVEAHLAECTGCQMLADDYRRIGAQLREVAYQAAPPALEDAIRNGLNAAQQNRADRRRASVRSLLRQAAVLIAACGLSALLAWHLSRSAVDALRLESDIVSAHVRSLLQDSTVQIASADRHTVRPWFNGRLDFAPNVKDLAPAGFPLVGARLDWIDGQRVAAVVYKRRLHTINVFMWPAPHNADEAPRTFGLKGYNAIAWSRQGIVHWAVSDLNAQELAQLQAAL